MNRRQNGLTHLRLAIGQSTLNFSHHWHWSMLVVRCQSPGFNSFSPIPKYNFQSIAVRCGNGAKAGGDLVRSGERVDESDTPIVSPATLSLDESSCSLTLPPCYLVNCHSTSSSCDIPVSFVLCCSFSVFFSVELGHTNRYCSCFLTTKAVNIRLKKHPFYTRISLNSRLRIQN